LKSATFRPAASADVDEAYLWYENQRQGLGEEFLLAVQNAVDSILENPKMYPVVRRDTRRILLNRFPYSLLYRLIKKQVVVIACFHAKRDPQIWQSRR
jgi:plasmid stabilization system protein ParE